MRRSAAILVVLLVGCGASSGEEGSTASLSPVGSALEASGFSCSEPAPYESKSGKTPLGTKPVEVLRCTVDDSPVVVLRWATVDEAEATASALTAAGCAAGRSNVAWVAEANWIAAADSDADLSPDQVAQANKAIAAATDGEVADYECVAH